MFNYFQFRYKRSSRRFRRDIRLLRSWSSNYINRHIINKWHQIRLVRGFVLMWLAIFLATGVGILVDINNLNQSTMISVPAPGGIYTEAEVGSVKSLNPILPESGISADINRLIYSGLTRYNNKRQLVGDLATSWQMSADGRSYTFHLRHGVKWHDGVEFKAADVAFTITAIQTPDTRSPLAASWQDVTTEIKDDYTIVLKLPTPLASFMDSTTLEILPRHILEFVDPSQMRENAFNQHPVGTGPFKLKTFAPSADEVLLEANTDYFLGRPKLDGFNFHFYDTSADALDAYRQHQVSSLGRLESSDKTALAKLDDLYQYQYDMPEETVLFFNNTDPALKDKALRQILSRVVNRQKVVAAAAGDQARAATQPLLPGQIGYTTKYALCSESAGDAAKALDDLGWKSVGAGKPRVKDGAQLKFTLVTLADGDLQEAADALKTQYAALGVQLTVKTMDVDQLQQSYLRPRNFQMVLFGINVGADPDVYAYWHSSQAKDPGVNLSGYNSADADRALESGRVKTDPTVRAAKYAAFLKTWNDDAPAVVLYQSIYTYGIRDIVDGPTSGRLGSASDRFYRVERWTVLRRAVVRGS